MNTTNNTQFLFEVGCLRHVDRQWKQFFGRDFANLSEHTLRVIWIAVMISALESSEASQPIDTGKVVKMALVHDLSESRSVDVHYLSRQSVERNEEQAIEDTLQGTALEKEFLHLWHEYEQRESIESKIVKDADNLDVDLEMQERTAHGDTLPSKWQHMRATVAKEKLYTKAAKQLWQDIYDTDPDSWHINGRTRVNAGDWKQEKST